MSRPSTDWAPVVSDSYGLGNRFSNILHRRVVTRLTPKVTNKNNKRSKSLVGTNMSSSSFNIAEEARSYLGKISTDLDRTVEFWLTKSHDQENGGFFTCLDATGEVYDTIKYGWLQGRQIWMYTQLYQTLERFRKPEILDAAISGGKFLMEKMKDPKTNKVFFSATAQGEGTKIQRTIFAEVFYVMAMTGLARVTGENIYKREALEMFKMILHWAREDDSDLGRPKLPGNIPVKLLATPMSILCLVHEIDELGEVEESKLDMDEIRTWAVTQIKAHIQKDGTHILEQVGENGVELEGVEGRKVVPGHAIECGWFLLKEAAKTGNKELKHLALTRFIEQPLEYGWDKTHEGLFYFLDVEGRPPTNLEWDMKLWWPHNEAMIALLTAFQTTQDARYWKDFKRVADYAYEHFVDASNGEWFGYLNRQGEVSLAAKGGPYKGCFHVARALMMCESLLTPWVESAQE